MMEQITKLKTALREADAVLIGAGAGLSTAAGFSYAGERFARYFGDFGRRFRFDDMYTGGFVMMRYTPEEFWAYFSRNIWVNRYMRPPFPVYEKLLALVREKEYFVLTTNVDHCFQKAGFDKSRLFYTQGDYGLWQCSKPCHKKTYDNRDAVREMLLSQGFSFDEEERLIPPTKPDGTTDFARLSMRIPTALLPRCPVCGEPMTMNLRSDDTFVEDEGWHAAAARYDGFVEANRSKRLLLWELGVGSNTPGIIKYPFWRMAHRFPKTTYACVNFGDAYAPPEIERKSILIDADFHAVLKELDG